MRNTKHGSKLLILSGAGRNVGKTLLGCNIIEQFRNVADIVAVKIVSHRHVHAYNMKLIKQEKSYTIWQENRISSKDSGRYFEAGANKVYYVEAKDNCQKKAFAYIRKHLAGDTALLICETGTLGIEIEDKTMIFVQNKDCTLDKNKYHYKQLSDIVIYSYSQEIVNPGLFITIDKGLWKLSKFAK